MVEDVVSAALTIVVQYLFFGDDHKATCFDWMFIADRASITGFTASVYYLVSLVEEAIHLLSALADTVVPGSLVVLDYGTHIRPR